MNTSTAPNQLTQPSTRVSHVAEVMGCLSAIIEQNHKLALDVEQHFSSVLRSQPPQSAAKDIPKEYLVDHADRLRGLLDMANNTASVLTSILDRAEL